MANVVISFISYDDGGGTALTDVYPLTSINIDDKYYTSCASNHINVSFDKTVDYMEAAINGKTIYKYAPNDQFSGTTCTASEMYSKWVDALSKA